jgi:hypothetical protein
MVKKISSMMLAILLGIACFNGELDARNGRSSGTARGGARGNTMRGSSMKSSGMRSAGSMRAGGMRSAGARRGTTAHNAGASRGAMSGGRNGAFGARNNGTNNAALIGGAAAAGTVAGAAMARTQARTGAGTVPNNVVSATTQARQSGQRMQANATEKSAINKQANALRAPKGGNTNRQNRPQSFRAGGRTNWAFWKNGRRNVVTFRNGIPYLWSSGWWYPWPVFWTYWPWFYYGGDYSGYYDECYDCNNRSCPNYCYDYSY